MSLRTSVLDSPIALGPMPRNSSPSANSKQKLLVSHSSVAPLAPIELNKPKPSTDEVNFEALVAPSPAALRKKAQSTTTSVRRSKANPNAAAKAIFTDHDPANSELATSSRSDIKGRDTTSTDEVVLQTSKDETRSSAVKRSASRKASPNQLDANLFANFHRLPSQPATPTTASTASGWLNSAASIASVSSPMRSQPSPALASVDSWETDLQHIRAMTPDHDPVYRSLPYSAPSPGPQLMRDQFASDSLMYLSTSSAATQQLSLEAEPLYPQHESKARASPKALLPPADTFVSPAHSYFMSPPVVASSKTIVSSAATAVDNIVPTSSTPSSLLSVSPQSLHHHSTSAVTLVANNDIIAAPPIYTSLSRELKFRLWCSWLKLNPDLPEDQHCLSIAQCAADSLLPAHWGYDTSRRLFVHKSTGCTSAVHPRLSVYKKKLADRRKPIKLDHYTEDEAEGLSASTSDLSEDDRLSVESAPKLSSMTQLQSVKLTSPSSSRVRHISPAPPAFSRAASASAALMSASPSPVSAISSATMSTASLAPKSPAPLSLPSLATPSEPPPSRTLSSANTVTGLLSAINTPTDASSTATAIANSSPLASPHCATEQPHPFVFMELVTQLRAELAEKSQSLLRAEARQLQLIQSYEERLSEQQIEARKLQLAEKEQLEQQSRDQLATITAQLNTTINQMNEHHSREIESLKRLHAQEIESLRSRSLEQATLQSLAQQVELSTNSLEALHKRLHDEQASQLQMTLRSLNAREQQLRSAEQALEAEKNQAAQQNHALSLLKAELLQQQTRMSDDQARLSKLQESIVAEQTATREQLAKDQAQLQREREAFTSSQQSWAMKQGNEVAELRMRRELCNELKTEQEKLNLEALAQLEESKRQLEASRQAFYEERSAWMERTRTVREQIAQLEHDRAALSSDQVKFEKRLKELQAFAAEMSDKSKRSADTYMLAQAAQQAAARDKQEAQKLIARHEENVRALAAQSREVQRARQKLEQDRMKLTRDRAHLTQLRRVHAAMSPNHTTGLSRRSLSFSESSGTPRSASSAFFERVQQSVNTPSWERVSPRDVVSPHGGIVGGRYRPPPATATANGRFLLSPSRASTSSSSASPSTPINGFALQGTSLESQSVVDTIDSEAFSLQGRGTTLECGTTCSQSSSPSATRNLASLDLAASH